MHELFAYFNKKGHGVSVLSDMYEEEIYILNIDTLEVYKASFVDGVYGMFDFVNNEISSLWNISENNLKDIMNLIENEGLEEDYPKLYKLLLEEKQ